MTFMLSQHALEKMKERRIGRDLVAAVLDGQYDYSYARGTDGPAGRTYVQSDGITVVTEDARGFLELKVLTVFWTKDAVNEMPRSRPISH